MFSGISRQSAIFRLIILEIIAVLIFALIIFVTNSIHQNQIREENRQYVEQRISYNLSLYKDWTGRIVDVAKSIAYTPQVQRYLAETDQLEKYRMYRDMQRYLSSVGSLRDEVSNIAFLDSDDVIYSYSSISVIPLNAIRQIGLDAQQTREPVFSYCYNQQAYRFSDRLLLFVALPVYSIYEEYYASTDKRLGSVVLQINSQVLYELIGLSAVQQEGVEQYLLDESGNIVASFTDNYSLIENIDLTDNKGKSRNMQLDNSLYYVVSAELEELDLKLVHIEGKSKVLSESYAKIYIFETILFIGLCLVMIMAFFLVANGVIYPMNNLIRHIKQLRRQENSDPGISLRGSMEIKQLGYQFNSLMTEKQELVMNLLATQDDLYKAELLRKQMEMLILKSQINPHFLANTLEVMQGMALREDQQNVAKMIKNLGAIFRYSLRAPDIVEIDMEINSVKAYLAIQSVRFENKLDWTITINPEVQHIKIPKMIIQPIVENAIHHGLSINKNGGALDIRVYVENERLFIKVADNGVGIREKDLSEITHRLSLADNIHILEQSESLGIINVHERIRHYYGNEYGIAIESRYGTGTTVIISLPVGGVVNV